MRAALAFTVLCACLLAAIQASVFIQNNVEHPEQPGKCLYEGLVIDAGASVTDRRECTKVTCRKSTSKTKTQASTYSISGVGCNHASTWPDNCYLEAPDLTKDFPECCPQLECDGPPEGPITSVG